MLSASLESATSATLLAGIKRLDAESWERFVTRYSPAIGRWGMEQGLPRDQAEDLTQEIFLKLMSGLQAGKYDNRRGRFRSWLKTVVVNAALDTVRGRQRYSKLLSRLCCPESENPLAALVEEEYQREVYLRALELVQAEVNPQVWTVFQETALEQRSPKQVSESLGLSIANVYVAKHRILQRLRQVAAELSEIDDRIA